MTWSVARVWSVAIALAAAAALYLGLESWLVDVQGSGGRFVAPSRATFASSIAWIVWALMAPAMLAFFRRRPVERRPNVKTAFLYIGASLVAAAIHGLIENPIWFWAVDAPPVANHSSALRVVWFTVLRAPTASLQFLAFAAVYHAIALARTAHYRELAASQAQAALAQAELRALKMRLEPHFLFNTLNAIVAYVRHDPAIAEEMIGRLSRLLRAVLQSSGETEVPLADELALVREYLALHRLRFGDRLTISVTADDVAASAMIPAMLLQPVVENAIQHGIAARPGAGRVSVEAREFADRLVLEVTDASPDAASTPLEAHGDELLDGPRGIGLSVTRARLQQLYGAGHRLMLLGRADGTTVRIELPFRPASA